MNIIYFQLNTQLHPVQRLGMSGAIPLPIPLPLHALMVMRGQPYLVTEFVCHFRLL